MKGSRCIVLLLLAVSVFNVSAANGSTERSVFRSDDEVVTDIAARFRGQVARNPVFNSVFVSSKDGNVVLTGKVRDAYLKERAMKAAAGVDGVRSVSNQIEILPASNFDDRLRALIYRRLRNDAALFSYFVGKDPRIQIIVEQSRVTLLGDVHSEVARVRAASAVRGLFGVLSVDNQIRVVRS